MNVQVLMMESEALYRVRHDYPLKNSLVCEEILDLHYNQKGFHAKLINQLYT